MAQHLPILPIILPLFAAVLIPLFGRIRVQYAWFFSVGATGFSFLCSSWLLSQVMTGRRVRYFLGNWEPPWGIEYVVDYLSGFVLVIISFMAFVVTVYSWKSVEKEIPKEKVGLFYAVFMLLVTGLLGIVITGDIFNLYVFLEISALSGYVLIAMGGKREALMASYNYLILGTIGATFILLGIGYLYMVTGSLNMADLATLLPPLYENKVVLTGFAFLVVGLCIKVALFPFHIWLPNAYTYAPSVVGTFMAATATKVSAYALVRIMFTVFSPGFDFKMVPVTEILFYLGMAAMLVGPVLAISQTDIRRMLAYSSVGQIGYIVLGISLGNQTGMVGGLVHLLNHALMKGGLFLVVGAIIYKTGITQISELKGMGKRMPLSMAAFTVSALSMIGVPLTVGFVSKWYLGVGALQAGKWIALPIILLSSLLTAVYFWRIIENVYFKGAQGQESGRQREEGPPGMVVPTLGVASLCLVFGVFAFIPVSIAELAAQMLLGKT